jgi:hypothetical protein
MTITPRLSTDSMPPTAERRAGAGYRLGIHHWGQSEQEAWEKRISEK